MAFTERLKVVIDVVTGNATNSLSSFRKSVADADGFTGKLKAGVGSLSSAFTSAVSSPTVLASAVTVAGIAAVNAANEFSTYAKTAIDLAEATGLSTEQASRWIAVADDMGIAAEDLTTPLLKIVKSIDSDKWTTYGIQTRDAAGNIRDANDILLDTLAMLGGIANRTERAKVGTELFGKGWANVAPIIGKSRREYQSLLDTVADGEVVTKEEAARAEEWRKAVDGLADAWKNLKFEFGAKAQSALTPYAEDLGKLSDELNHLNNATDVQSIGAVDIVQKIGRWNVGVTRLHDSYMFLRDRIWGAKDASEDFATITNRETVTSINTLRDASDETSSSLDDLGDSSDESSDSAEDLAEAEKKAAEATKRHSDEILRQIEVLDDLYGREYSQIERTYALKDAQDGMAETLSDAEASLREQRDAVVEVSEKYAGLNGATKGSQEFIDRQIASLQMLLGTIDKNSPLYKALVEYLGLLMAIPPKIATEIGVSTPSGAPFKMGYGTYTPDGANLINDYTGSVDKLGYLADQVFFPMPLSPNAPSPLGRALGGPVSKDSMYQVGEGGKPELLTDAQGRTYLIPGTNGVVTPIGGTGSTGSAGGMTFNVTITKPMVSGEQLANELKKYISRNGSAWLS